MGFHPIPIPSLLFYYEYQNYDFDSIDSVCWTEAAEVSAEMGAIAFVSWSPCMLLCTIIPFVQGGQYSPIRVRKVQASNTGF